MTTLFREEPYLKRRQPRDTRRRVECPLCFERAVVVAELPTGLYVSCSHCDWNGEIVTGPLSVAEKEPA